MNVWKQAFWLARFEIKTSIINIIAAWIFMVLFSVIFFSGFSSYLESNFFSFDILFILGLSYIPFFFRSKHYQYQKCADELYSSPTFIMMTQLPIPIKVLVKSRLLISFVYLVPFMVTIFPIVYVFVPGVSEAIDLPTYIVFCIIWLSLVFILGMMLPASDPGDKISNFKAALYFFFTFLLLFIIIGGVFYQGLGYGIVAAVIHLATHFGLWTVIVSLLLVFVSWKFWIDQMQKKTKKLDYL